MNPLSPSPLRSFAYVSGPLLAIAFMVSGPIDFTIFANFSASILAISSTDFISSSLVALIWLISASYLSLRRESSLSCSIFFALAIFSAHSSKF